MRMITLKAPLLARPIATDFVEIETPEPACPEGGVVIAVEAISLDPYVGSLLRGRHMGAPAPSPLEAPIPAWVVGSVFKTRAAGVREGDLVASAEGAWAERCALSQGQFRKVDPAITPRSLHLGVLGMPGLTAWAGVTQLAKVSTGDVFLVDAAAGAVGGAAGQIARAKGAALVVGIAGGAAKCAAVQSLYGFDACVDYKAPYWLKALDAALPEGASVHFENVGAAMATAALARLKLYGRLVLCGLVDQYHADAPPPQLPAGLIVGKRAQVMGLVVYDFYNRFDPFTEEMTGWLASGAVKPLEDKAEGLSAAPAHFERLMRGENIGKAVVAL